MATQKSVAHEPITSSELKAVLKRVKACGLSAEDKDTLAEILNHSIKLKGLIEKSSKSVGGKKIIATLPFGFDIVK
ncbi:hypothetical protein LHFGNBLO_006585 (plasmid) [Mesorhizobium sp. AR10]|uniref:hypothetical protein n=1 Tax=Mesorhizobium sp. AR10 TaxID=2865839 RepID=UPI00215F7299|nr:hypothetical protein [Mesorhizobium sp. AR10]UVK35721.1 hypothetical protein LHFGNBLO_006585 [Mesorhizobium sp. AR10]